MSRKLKIVKDVLERKHFANIEINNIFLKFFIRQYFLNCFQKQYVYINYLMKLNVNRKYSKYRNICLNTGKMKFVFKYFRLSRMKLKNFASYGYLVGVSKSSW